MRTAVSREVLCARRRVAVIASFRTSESAIADQVILDHPDQDEATGLNRNELNANDTASIPVTGGKIGRGKKSRGERIACVYMEG